MKVNYKTRISLILLTGLFIVSLITIISLYYVYKYKHVQILSKSNKIVQIFEDTFENIIHDSEYFKNIDFTRSTKKILQDFQKISKTVYAYNNNINGLSLIKQYKHQDYDEINKELIKLTNEKNLKSRLISNIIQNSQASKSTFSSIIMHSEPLEKTKMSVGLEISSELNRYLAIKKMHTTNSYVISRPVNLIHKYKVQTINSVIFYPIYKEKNAIFYKWFVAVPFTYKKILDNIFLENPLFNDLCIELIDNDTNSIVASHRMSSDNHMTLMLEREVNIENKQYVLKIFTDSLLTFDTFWQNIFGFLSGILFLFFLGYYLFYKEQRNIEISKLKIGLSEAQKISASGHCIWKKSEIDFFCSEGLMNVLKLNSPNISLHNLMQMIYKKEKRKIYKYIINLKKQNVSDNENIILQVNIQNCMKWLKIEYRVFYDNKNNIEEVFIVVQDITNFKELEISLKENNHELEKISITDHLTGANNRTYFDKKIKDELYKRNEYQKPFSILLIDIDHFKRINDTYGHKEGDRVLVQFVKLMQSQLRKTDTFARWGGEEFVILIPSIDKKHAIVVAEKLRRNTEKFIFSKNYTITCSIGIAEVEKNDDTDTLFNRADSALYYAKEHGRNSVKAS